MRWQKPVGGAMLVGVAVFWVWLIAADAMALKSAVKELSRPGADILLHFDCYAVTTDNEWIPMHVKCAPKDGHIMLEASVQFKKDVTLRETIIKDSYGVYEEIFDLESIFGSDPIMSGHKFKKGEEYGFEAQLGLYKHQTGAIL